MKYSLSFAFCLLLSGCISQPGKYSQLVKYSQQENSKYGEISFLKPEPTNLRPEDPVYVSYIRLLSIKNRSDRVNGSSRFFLSPGHYRATVFCNRNLMPDGTLRKENQPQPDHGPFEHVTFHIEQSKSYVLDCYLINEGREAVFTFTDSKTGVTRKLDTTYDD